MTDKLDTVLDGRSIELEHLDITSYLSAPNLINTCNKYERTVYLIFTDFIDRGWQKKQTAFYDRATHRRDKIVEIPENET